MPAYKYKLKDGTVRFYLKLTINKKTYFKRGFVNKLDALIYEASLFKKKASSKADNPKCIELDSLFVEYLKNKYKTTSAYRYLTLYRTRIFPFFSDYKVKDINNLAIDIFARQVNNLTIKSITSVVYLAKAYLKFLRMYGLNPDVNESLLFVYKKPYVEKKEFDFYTREEFDLFISAEQDSKYKLIFLLLFDYGLRMGELRGLKHRDFNLRGDKVFIKRCITNKALQGGQIVTSVKTSNSYRDYPLLDPIKKAYQDYIKTIDSFKSDDFVFASKCKNKVIGETTIKREQERLCKETNLRVIRLHEFRHSCATYLFNAGVEIEIVSAWLGHSDTGTTLRVYAHLLPNRKNKVKNLF